MFNKVLLRSSKLNYNPSIFQKISAVQRNVTNITPLTNNNNNNININNQVFRNTQLSTKRTLVSKSLSQPPKDAMTTAREIAAKKNKKIVFLRTAFFITAGLIGLLYWAWPKHNFPYPVAKFLRKGLWEERDDNRDNNGMPNYQAALKYYLLALDKADEVGMSKISDDYTGIELKVAEMYEKLNMVDNASRIYLELSYRYYDCLRNGTYDIDEMEKPHYIQKDLRCVIKWLQFNMSSQPHPEVFQFAKGLLLSHLLLAEEELMAKSPEFPLNNLTKDDLQKQIEHKYSGTINFENMINEDNIFLDTDGYIALDLEQKSSYAWFPFKDEFFTARDLYSAMCLSTKDIASAVNYKLTTLKWMVLAGMAPGQIMLSQANLGSLLYLRGEEFEGKLNYLQKHPESLNSTNTEGVADDLNLTTTMRLYNKSKDECYKAAIECYEAIIKFTRNHSKLRFESNINGLNPSVSQAIVLSTYGLGVVNLHLDHLPQAEKLLNDSLSMSKQIGFAELTTEAENELKKLQAIKAEKKQLESKQKMDQ
ncbi:uncharacterized protein SCDLUD_003992 [Saccharomycodes ludwigii]|uniref:uncharacterized protein n=1 Tax=Saccharomycodes ludwigii TaxID=36035 RepID=UPI001E8411FF|nr:hypothetical protein SCDLUD_003992 [Saccharomycodes ludwigii]KAH3899707.1 hypothetical protein SCDLUD_003992 [Saccharomycodes ludwigii]